MPKEKRIVFRIDEDIFNELKLLCEKNDKSVSKVLRNYIIKVIKQKTK